MLNEVDLALELNELIDGIQCSVSSLHAPVSAQQFRAAVSAEVKHTLMKIDKSCGITDGSKENDMEAELDEAREALDIMAAEKADAQDMCDAARRGLRNAQTALASIFHFAVSTIEGSEARSRATLLAAEHEIAAALRANAHHLVSLQMHAMDLQLSASTEVAKARTAAKAETQSAAASVKAAASNAIVDFLRSESTMRDSLCEMEATARETITGGEATAAASWRSSLNMALSMSSPTPKAFSRLADAQTFSDDSVVVVAIRDMLHSLTQPISGFPAVFKQSDVEAVIGALSAAISPSPPSSYAGIVKRSDIAQALGFSAGDFAAIYAYSHPFNARSTPWHAPRFVEGCPAGANTLSVLLATHQAAVTGKKSSSGKADASAAILALLKPLIVALDRFSKRSNKLSPSQNLLVFKGVLNRTFSSANGAKSSKASSAGPVESFAQLTNGSLSPNLYSLYRDRDYTLECMVNVPSVAIFYSTECPTDLEVLIPPVECSVVSMLPPAVLSGLGIRGSVVCLTGPGRLPKCPEKYRPIFQLTHLFERLLDLYVPDNTKKMEQTGVQDSGSNYLEWIMGHLGARGAPMSPEKSRPVSSWGGRKKEKPPPKEEQDQMSLMHCLVVAPAGCGKTNAALVLMHALIMEKILPLYVSLAHLANIGLTPDGVTAYVEKSYGIVPGQLFTSPPDKIVFIFDAWDDLVHSVRAKLEESGGLLWLLQHFLNFSPRVVLFTRANAIVGTSTDAMFGANGNVVSAMLTVASDQSWRKQIKHIITEASFQELTESVDTGVTDVADYTMTMVDAANAHLKRSQAAVDVLDTLIEIQSEMKDDCKTRLWADARAVSKEECKALKARMAEMANLKPRFAEPLCVEFISRASSVFANLTTKGFISRATTFRVGLGSRITAAVNANRKMLPKEIDATAIEIGLSAVALSMFCKASFVLPTSEVTKILITSVPEAKAELLLPICPLYYSVSGIVNDGICFEQKSYAEYYGASIIFQDPSLLKGTMCAKNLDITLFPGVLNFIRDMYNDADAASRVAFIDHMISIVKASKGAKRESKCPTRAAAIGQNSVRASMNALTILGAIQFVFKNLDLSGTSFCGAELHHCAFVSCNLSNCDMRWAHLSRSFLDRVDFSNSLFDNIDFEQSIPLHGHDGAVNAVAYKPDGTVAVSGGADATVRIWDASTGKCTSVLKGNEGPVLSVCFSRTGTFVGSGGADSSVRVWDYKTGQSISVITGHTGPVHSVRLSGDGSSIATGSSDNSVQIWLVKLKKSVARLEKSISVSTVAFSADGSHVALAGSASNSVHIWNIEAGREVAALTGHTGTIRCVRLNSDGKVAVSSGDDMTVRIWDVVGCTMKLLLDGHTAKVNAVDVNHDASLVASASDDKSVRVWKVATGGEFAKFFGHTKAVNSVHFESTGTRLVSCSSDGTLRLWDIFPKSHIEDVAGHSGKVNTVSLSENGAYAVSGGDDRYVRVWETASGHEVACFDDHHRNVTSVVMTPSGNHVASVGADRCLRVFKPSNCGRVSVADDHALRVNAVSAEETPAGLMIAAGVEDKTVQLWQGLSGRKVFSYEGHVKPVLTVSLRYSHGKLLSGSADGTIRVWDTNKGTELATMDAHEGPVHCLDSVKDAKSAVSVGRDSVIRFWDLKANKSSLSIEAGEPMSSVVYSADASKVFTACLNGPWIRIWDVASGKQLSSLCHGGRVTCLSASTNGKVLASGSSDNSLRFWNIDGDAVTLARIVDPRPSTTVQSVTLDRKNVPDYVGSVLLDA